MTYDPKHTCHVPDCTKDIPPKLVSCKLAWFKLPKAKRDSIWANYVQGQEIHKNPTDEYLVALSNAQQWWKENIKPCQTA